MAGPFQWVRLATTSARLDADAIPSGFANTSLYTGDIDYVSMPVQGSYWILPLSGESSPSITMRPSSRPAVVSTPIILRPRATNQFYYISCVNNTDAAQFTQTSPCRAPP